MVMFRVVSVKASGKAKVQDMSAAYLFGFLLSTGMCESCRADILEELMVFGHSQTSNSAGKVIMIYEIDDNNIPVIGERRV